MSDLNVISFTGRLGKDAELRYLKAGTAVWTASVGFGYGFGESRGTNWIRVSVFGKRAESLGGLNLAKGTAVAVTGELRLREYDNRDGGKSWAHEVNASDVCLIDKRQDAGNTSSSGPRGGAPARDRPQRATDAPADDFSDDDIPFITNRGNW